MLAPDLPPARIPPLLAPFVGADISAGMAAIAFGPDPPRYPYLLADLGTNGEFALALSPEEYLLASVPMTESRLSLVSTPVTSKPRRAKATDW